jgi:hypothetical protein
LNFELIYQRKLNKIKTKKKKKEIWANFGMVGKPLMSGVLWR